MPCGGEDVIKEFERVQYSYPYSSYSTPFSIGTYHSNWTTFDPETFEVVEEDHLASIISGCSTQDLSSQDQLTEKPTKPTSTSSSSLSPLSLLPSHPHPHLVVAANALLSGEVNKNNINTNTSCVCSGNKSCEIENCCSHTHTSICTSSLAININNLNNLNSSLRQPQSDELQYTSSIGSKSSGENLSGEAVVEDFELFKPSESVTVTTESVSISRAESEGVSPCHLGYLAEGNNCSDNKSNNNQNQQFCESSPRDSISSSFGGGGAPGPSPFLTRFPWKDQQNLRSSRASATNCNQINMSSSVSCGVSSSIFGGLCSGNSRRPSMFTAKYRMREERKKVLKMSLGKVKRIEDPESFLRRSVLINNTIKRLQKEVREEKMMRHGGSYTSKLSCSSYRKSFACSRLNEMHLSVVDEPDTTSSLMDHDDDPPTPQSSPLDNLVISKDHHNSPTLINSRKRQLNPDSEGEDCDMNAVLSQIFIPPTPCIISSIDDDDNILGDSLTQIPTSSSSCTQSSSCSSIQMENLSLCVPPPQKKSRLSIDEDPTASLLTAVTQDCSLDDDVDVDVDVDVVGDSELSDWPIPPAPIPQSQPPTSLLMSCSSILSPAVTSPLSLSLLSCSTPLIQDSASLCSSSSLSTSCSSSCDRNSILNTSPYATGLGRVMTVMSDNASDFSLMDIPPATRDSSDSCPSPSLTVSTSLATMSTILSPSSLCNGLMSPLPLCPTVGLPLLSPTSMSMSMSSENCSSSGSSSDESSSSDEDMVLSSDTKENTCSLPLSLPLSGIHSPLADHNSKYSSDININGGYNNNNTNNANSISNSINVGNNNNNSTNEMDKSQQYSSCGHSSIFGELQSVVFHSLIASLET